MWFSKQEYWSGLSFPSPLSTVQPGKSSSSLIFSILFQKWGCSIGFSPNLKKQNKTKLWFIEIFSSKYFLPTFIWKNIRWITPYGKYFKNHSFLGFHNWFSLNNISQKGEERSTYGTLLSQNFTSLSFSEKPYEVEIFSILPWRKWRICWWPLSR